MSSEAAKRRELDWDWPEIALTLMWRLAPKGVVISRSDLGSLPLDRVLAVERSWHSIHLHFIDEKALEKMAKRPAESGERPTVEELSGRWQKAAIVLLWKLAKNGIRLTGADRRRVPAHVQLLQQGHAQEIEFRFVSHAISAKIAAWERDNEGKIITERGHV